MVATGGVQPNRTGDERCPKCGLVHTNPVACPGCEQARRKAKTYRGKWLVAWRGRENTQRLGFLRGAFTREEAEQLAEVRNTMYRHEYYWIVPCPTCRQYKGNKRGNPNDTWWANCSDDPDAVYKRPKVRCAI